MLWKFLYTFSFSLLLASEEIFFFFFFFNKLNILVAMSTNQIQQIGQNSYVTQEDYVLKEHFCKTFVKISEGLLSLFQL